MLRFINKKIAIQWIILIGLLAFSIFTIIDKTQLANEQGAAFLFKSFVYFFLQYPYFGKTFIIIVLLLQILLLQIYFIRNEFSTKRSLLPACFYISILLLTKSLTVISPLFFTMLFFLWVICIKFNVIGAKIKHNAFMCGFVIALATGCDYSSIILLLIAINTLIINQFSQIKEVGIMIMGFLLVYFYFFSYYYLTNQLHEWLSTFQEIKVLGIFDLNASNSVLPIISFICLGVIYLYFIIRTRLVVESKVVVIRKKMITLSMRAILMGACLLVTNTPYPYLLGYLSVSIALYLAILAQERSPYYINEWVTLITFIALCL
jgi:hypothetical protein